MKAIFLDRDGTVNVGTPTYDRVDSLDKIEILPNTIKAMQLLAGLDYGVFFVTNQAGIAEGLITLEEFDAINQEILTRIEDTGIVVLETYLCPHVDEDQCECRKPQPKLLHNAAQKYDIDLEKSWMIGDRTSDVMTGVNAGARGILVKTGVDSVTSSDATTTVPSLLEAVQFIARQ